MSMVEEVRSGEGLPESAGKTVGDSGVRKRNSRGVVAPVGYGLGEKGG